MHKKRELFLAAATRVIAEESAPFGIGTLSEKLIHKTLKLYCEPDTGFHEVKYLGSVADIKNEKGIIEIQSRAFVRLRPKLEKFLPRHRVTLVHPIVAKKRLKWLDKDTGEITATGRSIKGKTVYDSAYDLYKIAEFLTHPNLRVRLVLLDCDEYRLLDGRGEKRKVKATKIDYIPRDIIDEIELCEPEDYLSFLPEELGVSFTAEDFKRRIHARSRYSYYYLRLLSCLGLLTREQGSGREYVYTRVK